MHPSAEVNFALPRQFSISVSSTVTPEVIRVLFLTIWGLIWDNYIQERNLEASSPKGDVPLLLVVVALRYWATSALGLEIHSGPELAQQHRNKGP
jgi:hypothetical protein